MDLSAKRIVVTGKASFLGRYLVTKPRQAGCKRFVIAEPPQFDLTLNSGVSVELANTGCK